MHDCRLTSIEEAAHDKVVDQNSTELKFAPKSPFDHEALTLVQPYGAGVRSEHGERDFPAAALRCLSQSVPDEGGADPALPRFGSDGHDAECRHMAVALEWSSPADCHEADDAPVQLGDPRVLEWPLGAERSSGRRARRRGCLVPDALIERIEIVDVRRGRSTDQHGSFGHVGLLLSRIAPW